MNKKIQRLMQQLRATREEILNPVIKVPATEPTPTPTLQRRVFRENRKQQPTTVTA